MPSAPLYDPADFDKLRVVLDQSEIQEWIPQRFEFAMLEEVLLSDDERNLYIGTYTAPADPWWARGHIPGRPLMPGVLMIETAAQLTALASARLGGNRQFLGFTGVENVKFRGQVKPGDRLIIVGTLLEAKPRRVRARTQGFVGDKMMFEGDIIGMPL